MIDGETLAAALAVFPPALRKALLYQAALIADSHVSTAEISLSDGVRRPVIRYNPKFVTTHCATPERLAFLIAHELCHWLLGHLMRNLSNLAADAIINALLFFVFDDPAYYSLVTDLYAPDTMPYAFLRPHSTITHSLYAELYTAHLTSEERLEDELRRYDGNDALLLGTHRARPASAEEIPGLRGLADYFLKGLAAKGHGRKTSLLTQYLQAAKAGWAGKLYPVLARFVHKPWINHLQIKLAGLRHISDRTPVPNPYDRKGLFDVYCGAYHPFWEAVEGRAWGGQALIYWDVSASTDPYKADLLALLQKYRDVIAEPLYQFSTELAPCSYRDLAVGKVITTGGTCIMPVLKHLIGSRASCAVIITDGFYEPVLPALAPGLKQKRILMVYTPDHKKDVMKSFAEAAIVLE
jgi:hypothetical protein